MDAPAAAGVAGNQTAPDLSLGRQEYPFIFYGFISCESGIPQDYHASWAAPRSAGHRAAPRIPALPAASLASSSKSLMVAQRRLECHTIRKGGDLDTGMRPRQRCPVRPVGKLGKSDRSRPARSVVILLQRLSSFAGPTGGTVSKALSANRSARLMLLNHRARAPRTRDLGVVISTP